MHPFSILSIVSGISIAEKDDPHRAGPGAESATGALLFVNGYESHAVLPYSSVFRLLDHHLIDELIDSLD